MLYRIKKVKVRSLEGDTDYFDIIAGVLQGDTFVPYLYVIFLDYELRMSIDKMKERFQADKKSRRYPGKNNYGR